MPLGQISGMVIIYYIRIYKRGNMKKKFSGVSQTGGFPISGAFPLKKSCHFGTSSSRTRGWATKSQDSPFQDGKSCSKPGDEFGHPVNPVPQLPTFELIASS